MLASPSVKAATAAPMAQVGRLRMLAERFARAWAALGARRDALVVLTIRVASAAVLYLSQAALARWMGAADYGVYVVAWTTVLVLGGISSLGLNQAAMRLVAEHRARAETALLAGLVGGSLGVAFATGTGIALLGLAGLWYLGPAVTGPYVLPLYLALVCIPMFAVTDVQDGIGRGRGWMLLALLPPYLLRPLLVLVAMAAAAALGLPLTAPTAVSAAILATWATGLLQLTALGPRLWVEMAGVRPETDWRRWLGVGLPLMAITVAEIALQTTDVLILARVLPPETVAVYYAAAKTMSLVLYVHYAAGSAYAGRIAALGATGDTAGLKRAVAEAVRVTFWPSLAAAALILAIGQPLLALFGTDFAAGYPVMALLVAGFLARAAVGPADTILRMLGAHRLSAAISVGTALLNVALLLVLVPRHGMLGAAAATALALGLEAALNWLAARRALGLDVGFWQAA
jgi:O-antigen/teichoic acid export membrane protein